MKRLRRQFRLRQIGTVEPGRTVDRLRRHQRTQQRPVAAREHLRVAPPGQLAHLEGIPGGQRQRHVAGHHGDAQHLQLLG